MSDTHAHSVAFVRDTMLPESEPPVAERGALKWIRENLVSSWLNGILTVLSLLFIWFVLSHVVPWFWHMVWNADSLRECREIRDQIWGAGTPSACFAVIHERWPQLLVGFYPADQYWRPVLALILFLVALGPVLFNELPRKMLWFSVGYPFLMYWLMWGGSAWGPVTVAAGFALGYVAFRLIAGAAGNLAGVIGAILVPILYWLLLAGPIIGALASAVPLRLEFVPSDDFGGFMLSFIIGISGIALSLPLGVLLALGRQSNLFIINKVSIAFIEIIRGVPLIVWLFTASLLRSVA